MKAKSIIGLFVCLIGFGAVTTSCEDMLTPDITIGSDGDRTISDTVNNFLGIMRAVQQVAEQHVILGEARGDLVTTTSYTSDSIERIVNFRNPVDGENELLNRAAYYNVINHCNYYLQNVDSTRTLNYNYLMKKEVAQVILVRAWAYMQLVQNYGRVPYITVPVSSAGTGWETNPAEGWVSLAAGEENLLNRLLSTGLLLQAYNYEKVEGRPSYGAYFNGAVSMQSRLTMFPADVIMGELYLLCAQTQADYEKAASYFYEYLSDDDVVVGSIAANTNCSWIEYQSDGKIRYLLNSGAWNNYLKASAGYANMTSGNVITFVPSAAASNFGLVLKRIPEIYGYSLTSTNTTRTVEQDDPSNDYVEQTGAVNVSGVDYRLRQLQPSKGYELLNESQIYAINDIRSRDEEAISYPENVGDARNYLSAPIFNTHEEGRLRFIQKFTIGNVNSNGLYTGGAAFRYSIPLYTIPQIYLHFAEAINRAGFPRYAFTILREGLNPNFMPVKPAFDAQGRPDGKQGIIYEPVSVDEENHVLTLKPVIDSVSYRHSNLSYYKGANHISPYELVKAQEKPWLDFSNENLWDNVLGIHELGCGRSSLQNTAYAYENVVEQRIADEAVRSGLSVQAARKYARRMMDDEESGDDSGEGGSEGDDEIVWTIDTLAVEAPSAEALAAQINAVETLIADEAALQLGFEGFRYYDLMRMARHKNYDPYFGANYGSVWMAWLIARRDLGLKPYEQPTRLGNATIYNLLSQGESGWYLQSPH